MIDEAAYARAWLDLNKREGRQPAWPCTPPKKMDSRAISDRRKRILKMRKAGLAVAQIAMIESVKDGVVENDLGVLRREGALP